MATPIDVDRSAPVLAHHEVEIRAPLGRSGSSTSTLIVGRVGKRP